MPLSGYSRALRALQRQAQDYGVQRSLRDIRRDKSTKEIWHIVKTQGSRSLAENRRLFARYGIDKQWFERYRGE